MPISSLVVTLSEDPPSAAAALEAFQRDPRFTVGRVQERRAALVLETASARASKLAWQSLEAWPGVLSSELLMVHFEDEEAAQ